MPTLALEDGVSRAPFFLGAHKDQLLSASVADRDDLLRRTFHAGLLSSPCGLRLYLERAAWLRADANFTYLRGEHKINGPLLEGTYARREATQPL